ncbi:MAG: penicillin-binding protein 2 [Ignavibacteria bacterium]|nr:penicillin-binding protein 2 [Ignavibacteria bacterium]
MAINDSIGGKSEFASLNRMKIFQYLVLAFTLVFTIKLFYLQIVKGQIYRSESEQQAIKKLPVAPLRGNIFDRNGILLVHNKPSFSVTLTPNSFRKESIPLLCSILPVDSAEIFEAMTDYKHYLRFAPWRFYRDADISEIANLEEYSDFLPGIDIVVESKRLYEFNFNMAHLLGYTREITKEQLEKNKFFKPGDVIGQTGIEKTYDNFLRGEEGVQFVAINNLGKKISSFNRGQMDVSPTNGFDIKLSIDKRLQEKAENMLADKRGAVVAIDPSNGDVLILASKPDYDPREFSGKVPAKIYNVLYDDPGKPLFHRAIMAQYPPGSTFKMVHAIAALEEGIIDENTTFVCRGGFDFGGRTTACHGVHGAISLKHAIQASCNAYFNQLALKIGMTNFEKYGQMFGFGEKTAVDIPNEQRGRLPTLSWLNKSGNVGYSAGKLVNYGIGQGELLVTPIQMAVYAAALGNGGIVHQPHVVRSVMNNITNKWEDVAYQSRQLKLSERTIRLIRDAMFDVVNTPGGTATNAKIEGISICGKTGTAQNPHGQDHSWFICFAPKDNPKIAICALVENAGFGATVAAPIASELIKYYFHPEYFKRDSINAIQQKIDSTQKKAIASN